MNTFGWQESLDSLLSDVWDTRTLIEVIASLDPDDEDEAEELERAKELETAVIDAIGPIEYKDGAQVISDDYFETYAEEFADDIGAIDRNASWPISCIDWEAAADELKMDYSSFEFEGTTWWVR